MLKNILNLDGAQQLSKNEQKEINGSKVRYKCENNAPIRDVNACLCNGGIYDAPTHSCLSGTATGNIHETATGCCYSNSPATFEL